MFFRHITDPRFSRQLLVVGDMLLGKFRIATHRFEEVGCEKRIWYHSLATRLLTMKCVCRSVSAGYSTVTCSRAVASASDGAVGSRGRTSTGAAAGAGNPGHTFRIPDPQNRSSDPRCSTDFPGGTATSHLTLNTKLCVIW